MGDETISTSGEPGAEEAEALVTALNHSAERVQTLWFSFLTVMLYLAIATSTTTHRMLFLKDPLNLPVLNIKLPLLGFYILTPVIFVVIHFYLLLNLVLLARTARSFEDTLERATPEDGEAREAFRMRIENTLFVQLLVGGRLEREGINARLLSLMALITLALAPVALMLMFEVCFLPYHSWQITWLHRGLLALDLALVWTLWPGYRSGWGVRLWPKRFWTYVWLGALSAVALPYAVAGVTFPDEQMYLATFWVHGSIDLDLSTGLISSHHRPKWYDWIAPVNTLDLHGEDLIDDAKLKQIVEKNESSAGAQRWAASLSLKWRDLTGANLEGADLRHVDLSHATLNRANLNYAWAEKAHFDAARLQGALLSRAQLQGALLSHAQLQGASLDRAQLQGASLDYAQLQGASLDRAQLQGASLDYAHLQGASLDRAKLQGTSLDRAQLQGTSLAELQGAWLVQGALLDEARLQGASLDYAQLQSASFDYGCAWRADARSVLWKDTKVHTATGQHEWVSSTASCDWTAASFAALKQLIADEVPEGDKRRDAMKRIEERLDPTKALEGEDEMAKIWAARERESPTPEAYAKSLAGQLRELGCAAEGAPYVLHGLIAHLSADSTDVARFRFQGGAAKDLAAAFLANCPGAQGLSEADKKKLKEIATHVVWERP